MTGLQPGTIEYLDIEAFDDTDDEDWESDDENIEQFLDDEPSTSSSSHPSSQMTGLQPGTIEYLDIEAFDDTDDEDWESDDENIEQFLDDEPSTSSSQPSHLPSAPFDNPALREEEARLLECIAESYTNIPSEGTSRGTAESTGTGDPWLHWRDVVASNDDSFSHTSLSSSTGPRLPYHVGKRSRLTGLPIPTARERPKTPLPPIFGKVDRERLKTQKKNASAVKSVVQEQHSRTELNRPVGKNIPPKDWTAFIERRAGTIPLRRLRDGEWVQIRRGRYRGDVGFVWKRKATSTQPNCETSDNCGDSNAAHTRQQYFVFLVPRLNQTELSEPLSFRVPHSHTITSSVMSKNTAPQGSREQTTPSEPSQESKHKRKRKHRPPAALFDPNRWPRSRVKALGQFGARFKDPKCVYRHPEILDGTDWSEHLDHSFRLDGRRSQTMVFGLHAKLFGEEDLYPAHSMPTELYEWFLLSCHPLLRRFPLPIPLSWQFHSGDYVECTRTGIRGWLVDVQLQGGQATVDVDHTRDADDIEELRTLMVYDLIKIIDLGHFITVLAGPHEGKTGFVIEKASSFVGVIERDVRTTHPDFYVHVNSIQSTTPTWVARQDIPWRDVSVLILKKGPYRFQRGVVKDVLRSRRRIALFLTIYMPDLDCSETFMYPEVAEFVTGKPLLIYQPLSADFLPRFALYKDVYQCASGPVPWINTWVHVIKRHYKGMRGVVRGVDKQALHLGRPGTSLVITVELHVFTMGQVNPSVKIDYAYIREVVTGKTLEAYQPLRLDQAFYAPIVTAGLDLPVVPFKKTKSQTPAENPDTNDDPVDSVAGWEIDRDEIELEEDIRTDNDLQSSWMMDNETDFHDGVNAWWASMTGNEASPCDDDQSTPSDPLDVSGPPIINHWIMHPKLRGIALYVEVQGGVYDTSKLKSGALVKVEEDRDGVPVVRIYVGNLVGEIEASRILPYRERPKPSTEMALMVVARGDDMHIGKLVRRVHHFYRGTRSDQSHWFILGVVDISSGKECLTSERLDIHPDNLEYVEETGDERRYSKKLFREVRETAKLAHKVAEIRPTID